MYQGHRVGAVLLMAGSGFRFGKAVPKQFHLLGSKKVYLYTLDVLLKLNVFDEIVLVAPKDWLGGVKLEAPGVCVVEGGKSRQESSLLGLNAFAIRPDIVLIHDAVRPFVSEEILLNNIQKAIEYGAVDTCIPSADTLVYAPGGDEIASVPKREEFLRGQTPQTFRFSWIWEAHLAFQAQGVSNLHDDCQLVLAQGRPVYVVRGSDANFKITTELDLLFANLVISCNCLV